jgi:hypothetical protein
MGNSVLLPGRDTTSVRSIYAGDSWTDGLTISQKVVTRRSVALRPRWLVRRRERTPHEPEDNREEGSPVSTNCSVRSFRGPEGNDLEEQSTIETSSHPQITSLERQRSASFDSLGLEALIDEAEETLQAMDELRLDLRFLEADLPRPNVFQALKANVSDEGPFGIDPSFRAVSSQFAARRDRRLLIV